MAMFDLRIPYPDPCRVCLKMVLRIIDADTFLSLSIKPTPRIHSSTCLKACGDPRTEHFAVAIDR